jgi:hypothetical protein
MTPIDHLPLHDRKRLYALRMRVQVGIVTDWPADSIGYISRQTHDDCRYVSHVWFMVPLCTDIANKFNVHLFSYDHTTDSPGDHWMQLHKHEWTGEAA